jgi:hypothetical protein
MKRIILHPLLLVMSWSAMGQISFFNMPNPDMLPDVGYAYAEVDVYRSLKGNDPVNATVTRLSVQATPFLEVGTNFWFNPDHPQDPNRVVLATKWKVHLFKKNTITMSLSPGSWTSFYFDKETPIKNILYTFIGINHEEGPKAYTRLMVGGYSKFFGDNPVQYGMIAGVEHRFSDKIEFVTDYFQGSGEGFGLATGIVFYAAQQGHNLPLYFAYQFDNDSRANDVFLFEIGWFFRMFGKKSASTGSRFNRQALPAQMTTP